MLVEIVIFLITFVISYLLYSNYCAHKYFFDRGVKFLPSLPFYGNAYGSINKFKHMAEEISEIYNAFPEERYVGYMEGSSRIIIIRDVELTKAITVKNFDHFVNHRDFFPPEADLFGKSLFAMKDEKWRDMRTTLSPAFTGSKMKLMLPSITEVAMNTVNYLKGKRGEDIDLDDLLRRYANDVIASTAFGLQVNSFEDMNNEFFMIGQGLFKFTFWQTFVMMLYQQLPWVTRVLGLKIFPDTTTNFFRRIVSSTIEHREKNNVERPDMIQLLMEASKGTLKPSTQPANEDVGFAAVDEILNVENTKMTRKWTLDELVGQVFLFFQAGFETSASSLVLTIHELAINEDVQEKLYQEIKSFKETNELAYENLNKLKYLDCVLNETLRKWGAAVILDRVCVKPYELPPPREGGKPYMLKPGDVVYNMVNAIHWDAKYYQDPFKYDPERFSEENRHKITPFTYLPFGSGPRNCIGSRMALMELKVLLFHLVFHLKIVKCEKTSLHPRLQTEGFLVKTASGSWVRFEPRQ